MDHFSVSSGVGISYEKIKPLNIAIKAIVPELHKLGDILNDMPNNAEAVVLLDDFLTAVKREILFGGD